jgi:ubiquinone/menaquinone biosynthesis C-methylase UbiE
VLGTGPTEQARLLRQGAGLEAEASWLLDRMGVGPGWRTLDVGCGPLGILDLLAARVGAAGEVVGLEREPRLLALAEQAVAERGLANVRLVAGDAQATELPRASFDLAHERLVLISTPAPERIVAEMVALTRPGGFVAAEDFDSRSPLGYPPHPAWDRLWAVQHAVLRRRGLDPAIGRRLAALLEAAGLAGVEVRAHAQILRGGLATATQMLATFAGVREEAIAAGLATAEELDETSEALRAHLTQPGTLTMRLLFQAWGRTPAE